MRKITTREIALASCLGALSAISEVMPGPPFDVQFPLYPRISWDITGVPMMISLLIYGPLSATYTCIIGCSIIFLRGNVYGGTFKLIAELATLLAFAALKRGIIINSLAATTSRVAAMTVANFYLLQFFYGAPVPYVTNLLPLIGLFNATQALINIIPAYIIYMKIRTYVKGEKEREKEDATKGVSLRIHNCAPLFSIEQIDVGRTRSVRM